MNFDVFQGPEPAKCTRGGDRIVRAGSPPVAGGGKEVSNEIIISGKGSHTPMTPKGSADDGKRFGEVRAARNVSC